MSRGPTNGPTTPVRGQGLSWQEKLADHCRLASYPPPAFNIVSDRRGGRTAWSATVLVPTPNSSAQQLVQARFWYDGQHVHNAKEDAAEVALRYLQSGTPSTPSVASSTPDTNSGTPGGGGWPPSYGSGWPGAQGGGGWGGHGSGPGGSPSRGGAAGGWPRSPPARR